MPIGRWFRTTLREFASDHLLDSRLARSGLVKRSGAESLLAAHVDGRADYAHQLWTLLALELWHRTFIEP